MKYNEVKKQQKELRYDQMQLLIDSGVAWKMEGSVGRLAMNLIESGACMLPKKAHHDCYGNYIPSRDELKEGTKGTFQNSVRFYEMNQ